LLANALQTGHSYVPERILAADKITAEVERWTRHANNGGTSLQFFDQVNSHQF